MSRGPVQGTAINTDIADGRGINHTGWKFTPLPLAFKIINQGPRAYASRL